MERVDLSRLTHLTVSSHRITDLDGLLGATQLREIDLNGCKAIEDLQGLHPTLEGKVKASPGFLPWSVADLDDDWEPE